VFKPPQIFVYVDMMSVLTSSSQKIASCFLFHVTYKLDNSLNFTTKLLKASLFFSTITVFVDSLTPPLNKSM